jgi:hypothetical protein
VLIDESDDRALLALLQLRQWIYLRARDFSIRY